MASKKLISIFALFIILSIILSSVLVMAQDEITVGRAGSKMAEKVTDLINRIQDVGEPIFSALLGKTQVIIEGTQTEGEMLFIKILAFMLVTLIIYGILGVAGNPFGEGWINVVAGVIVSILGIRLMPPGFLEAMAIPQIALIGTIVLVVPFIFAFFLIEIIKNKPVRKILWISYLVLISALWFYNWDNAQLGNFIWIYPIIIALSILALWRDGTIQRWFEKERGETATEAAELHANRELRLKLIELKKKLGNATSKSEVNLIKSQIQDIEGALK